MRVIALGPKPTAWGNGRCESADPARTQCPLHGPRLLAEPRCASASGRTRRMSREADGGPQSTPRGAERPPPGRLEVDRHRRHLTVRRLWLQPRGHPHRAGKLAQPSRGQGLGPAGVPESRRFCELGHTQHQGRSEKMRKFGREGAPKERVMMQKWRETMA